jgi:O-antigen/teichoic acid export membrane protein
MATATVHEKIYETARRRVIAKTAYWGVVGLWVVLAVVQVTIWFLTTPGGYFWPAWPILATSIAAIAWGVPLYARRPVVSDTRIRAEMARMRAEN